MIIGSMVVKNEADRYLAKCLAWNTQFIDTMFIYDDQSSDDTAEIASRYGILARRKDDVPSFIEHEGQFRRAGWLAMRAAVDPQPGDFILSFDADEFLVADTEDVRSAINVSIAALRPMHAGVVIPFQEVFDITSDGMMMYRTDGFWNRIKGQRLYKFIDNDAWPMLPMASGSAPLYVAQARGGEAIGGLTFLHLGYAKQEDRLVKYERYKERGGHNERHVASIVQPSSLTEWRGVNPLND